MTQQKQKIFEHKTTNKPVLTGTINDDKGEKIGKIAYWYNRRFNRKTPLYKGEIEIDGKTHKTALYENVP